MFTRLSDREELELDVGEIPPAERSSDFHVAVHRDTAGSSAVAWARAQPENASASVEAATIGGRDAARITSSDRMNAVSFAIRASDRVYLIDTHVRREGVDSAAFLGPIAATFTSIAAAPLPTPYPKAPREGAQELAAALANAFTQRDAAGVAIRMRGCTLAMHAVVEPPEPNNACCILNRAIFPFVEALRPALAGGNVTVSVDPATRSMNEGGLERFFVVSQWTENGKTRQVDLLLSELGGRWYWSGAIHRFPRGDRSVCYGRIWSGVDRLPTC